MEVQVKQMTKVCWNLIAPSIRLRLLGKSRFKPFSGPRNFLLKSKDCIVEIYLLLAKAWSSLVEGDEGFYLPQS